MATYKSKQSTVKTSQVRYDGTHAHSKRRATMSTNGVKERIEEIRKAGEATAEELRRTGEEFAKAASSFDVKGMSKAWTQGYLHGLQALFLTQEQTEGVLRE